VAAISRHYGFISFSPFDRRFAAFNSGVDMPTTRKLLNSRDVVRLTGLSRVTIWRLSRNPAHDFPESIQITENRVGWFEDEIVAWLESRPRVLATR
jgi:prophage regulatory protein